jgi:hypothetical protein
MLWTSVSNAFKVDVSSSLKLLRPPNMALIPDLDGTITAVALVGPWTDEGDLVSAPVSVVTSSFPFIVLNVVSTSIISSYNSSSVAVAVGQQG